jgi:hypothetical protein
MIFEIGCGPESTLNVQFVDETFHRIGKRDGHYPGGSLVVHRNVGHWYKTIY